MGGCVGGGGAVENGIGRHEEQAKGQVCCCASEPMFGFKCACACAGMGLGVRSSHVRVRVKFTSTRVSHSLRGRGGSPTTLFHSSIRRRVHNSLRLEVLQHLPTSCVLQSSLW